jgi:hypothetical protein
VTADRIAEDEIDCRGLKYSRSRQRPTVASAAEDDIMMVVVVVVRVVDRFEFGHARGHSSSDGICL